MDTPAPLPAADQRRGPHPALKLVISLLILVHGTAILACVLSGGQPFVMKQLCSVFRPYLRFMWIDNAYRFYAPDPGPTDVLWYHLKYEGGAARWYQVPRREDFTLRMPFQRHMSIALLASNMTEAIEVPLGADPEATRLALEQGRRKVKYVLDPRGLVHFRSYARHIARQHATHPHTGGKLLALDVYKAIYHPRSPYDIRMQVDMYDPRKVTLLDYGSFDVDGHLIDDQGHVTLQQRGFSELNVDDFFVDLLQSDILPLLQANARLPDGQRRTLEQVLTDYGIPYPLVQPILKLTPAERDQFFARPHDRDTLKKRYEDIVKRDDVPMRKPQSDREQEQRKKDAAAEPRAPNAEAPRSVQ